MGTLNELINQKNQLIDALGMQRDSAEKKMAGLRAKIAALVAVAGHPIAESVTGFAKDNCDDPECLICGVIDCPHSEPLHYHHDGCPACDAEDVRKAGR